MSVTSVTIRPMLEEDREWVRQFIRHEWHDEAIITRGKIVFPAEHHGFLAELEGEVVGLATYRFEELDCELLTLNSLRPGMGIGTALIKAVEEEACSKGMRRVWLITTNDNLNALRFYQKRGYHIVTVYPNAIAESRKLKPAIPLTGAFGIPIRDEIELELLLNPS